MSGRRTHTLSSVLLASNLFLSAYCPAAGSERYFVEDYFAVAAVFGAEIQANDLSCNTHNTITENNTAVTYNERITYLLTLNNKS